MKYRGTPLSSVWSSHSSLVSRYCKCERVLVLLLLAQPWPPRGRAKVTNLWNGNSVRVAGGDMEEMVSMDLRAPGEEYMV